MKPKEAAVHMVECEVAARDTAGTTTDWDGFKPVPAIGVGTTLSPDGEPRLLIAIHDEQGERGVALLDESSFAGFIHVLKAGMEACAKFAESCAEATAH